MPKMIFVNLPVADLTRSMAFYDSLGFVNVPAFTDETAAAMQWSETIVLMLVTRERWGTFTDRPIASPDSSEVMLAVSCDSRAEVDRMVGVAAASGGSADINPSHDHGFMFSRSFADPDGHVWEPVWMEPAPAPDAAHGAEAPT